MLERKRQVIIENIPLYSSDFIEDPSDFIKKKH